MLHVGLNDTASVLAASASIDAHWASSKHNRLTSFTHRGTASASRTPTPHAPENVPCRALEPVTHGVHSRCPAYATGPPRCQLPACRAAARRCQLGAALALAAPTRAARRLRAQRPAHASRRLPDRPRLGAGVPAAPRRAHTAVRRGRGAACGGVRRIPAGAVRDVLVVQ